MNSELHEILQLSSGEEQVKEVVTFYSKEFKHKDFVKVVTDIVSAFRDQGRDDYQAVLATERICESIAHRDITSGLCLMIELLPMAGDAFAHDVWDGIGLWIDAEGNADVLSYLRSQYVSADDMDKKEIYAEQMSYIEHKLS